MPQGTPSASQTAPVAQGARTAPTATEMYQAARLASRELHAQLDQLGGERGQLQEELMIAQNPVDRQGLESRLQQLDARIVDMQKQVASADAMLASRAAIPGVGVQEIPRGPDIPPEAVLLGISGMAMTVLLPMSIAWGIRYVKRGAAAVAALPSDLAARLTNIERSVEAVAIELERLGEGQRFVTQLLADGEKRRQTLLSGDSGQDGRER